MVFSTYFSFAFLILKKLLNIDLALNREELVFSFAFRMKRSVSNACILQASLLGMLEQLGWVLSLSRVSYGHVVSFNEVEEEHRDENTFLVSFRCR